MDRQAVVRGFAWTSLYSLVSKVVFPLANLVVARKLGPAVLGTYAIIQTTIDVADAIRDAGIAQNYYIEKDPDARTEATYAGLSLVSTLIPVVILLLLTAPMARFFGHPEYLWAFPVVCGCLILNALGMMPNARMLRKGLLKEQGRIGVIAGGAGLILTIVLVVGLKMGFAALVIQLVFGQCLALALLLRQEPLSGFRASLPEVRELFQRTRTLYGANLLNNLFLQSDVFVIKRLLNDTSVGLYNVAQNIGYKPAVLISFPLSRTLQIAFSQAAGDTSKLASALYRSLSVIVLFVIPIYVFLGLGSYTIVSVLYGEAYLGAVPALSALCFYLGLRTLGNISGSALVPAGHHKWTLYPWYGALTVTGVGVWWKSHAPTLMGLVWVYVAGAVVAYVSIIALGVWFVRGERGLYLRVGRAALATAATSSVLLVVFHLPLVHWARFLLAIPAGVGTHALLLGALYGAGFPGVLSRRGVRTVWERL